ncbi:MAG: hypothetical protein J0H69_00655 [Burkholderiales bacterium]|nr:hypothetical protein [Burkholderiales bacterium]
MAAPAVLALLPFAERLLEKFIPDPQAKATAALELARMEQAGELARLAAETDLAKGQLAINAAEAAHASVWVAGWRPAIGWVCAVSLAFKFVGGPSVQLLARLAGHDVALPDIDASELWPVLLAMLGVGGLAIADRKTKT